MIRSFWALRPVATLMQAPGMVGCSTLEWVVRGKYITNITKRKSKELSRIAKWPQYATDNFKQKSSCKICCFVAKYDYREHGNVNCWTQLKRQKKRRSCRAVVIYDNYHKCRICDVIKQNESELANIAFKIQLIISLNFLCILLFWASPNLWFLLNRKSNSDGIFT